MDGTQAYAPEEHNKEYSPICKTQDSPSPRWALTGRPHSPRCCYNPAQPSDQYAGRNCPPVEARKTEIRTDSGKNQWMQICRGIPKIALCIGVLICSVYIMCVVRFMTLRCRFWRFRFGARVIFTITFAIKRKSCCVNEIRRLGRANLIWTLLVHHTKAFQFRRALTICIVLKALFTLLFAAVWSRGACADF